jgi:hypothetical protein
MSGKPCRNCGSMDLYSKEVTSNGGYGPVLLPLGFWTNPKLEIKVCGHCGLLEWFVPARFLAKVKDKFSKA